MNDKNFLQTTTFQSEVAVTTGIVEKEDITDEAHNC
jgi:hypothetical protein